MSQWIKYFPIPPLYISFLLLWLYFAIQGSLLAFLGFLALLIRLVMSYSPKIVGKTLMILGFFALFFLWSRSMAEQKFHNRPESLDRITILPDTMKVNGDSLSFRGKEGDGYYQVYYKLKSEEEKKAFQELSDVTELEIEGELSLAEEARNFGGFDYQAYLKTQGIYRTLKIKSIHSAQKVSSWNPFVMLSSLRRKALVFIRKNFPAPMSHYMTGLLFGYLDTDFEEMGDIYSSLGIIHLFALSGMQVGFFLDGFRKCLLRLGVKMETVDVIQVPFSFLYAGLTGFSVSVIRSLVQKLISQCGVRGLDNFALTIMVLFVLLPNYLLTAGGVLSCAYAFIISMLNVDGLGKYKKILVESVTISLGILPILIFYFSEFQPWSILLTFFFAVVFDVFLLPGLTLIFMISPLVKVVQVNFLFVYLEDMIRWVASLASRPLVFGKPDGIMLLLLLLVLACLSDYWSIKKIRNRLCVLLALLFFLVKHPLENEITVLDIGQGDSIFLRDWTGKTVLIDVGGKVEFTSPKEWQKKVSQPNATRTLIPYLKSRGVGKIDKLVLTHTEV